LNIKGYIVISFFLFVFLANSQNNIGFLPSINLNKSLKKDYSFNIKNENRFDISNNDYLISDISLIAAKKIAVNHIFALGFLTRLNLDNSFYRSVQQYTLLKRYRRFRAGYRFLSDQTFEESQLSQIRFRLRMTAEIPLNGQFLNEHEFYLKVGNEYLNSWETNLYNLETRITPVLGYEITVNNKLEFGLDYRIKLLSSPFQSTLWLNLSWYLKFK